MKEKLRIFLEAYIGQGELKKDKVQQDDVDMLINFATDDHIEQEIIDYGTAHPEAPFWDFLRLIKPPTPEEVLKMQMELDAEDDDD
ncbi:MAG: hypothetical protein K2P04_10515 [Oscillospiraceae bacterium]|nr:hypothetical protein [Oscillospiraceae bacterium]